MSEAWSRWYTEWEFNAHWVAAFNNRHITASWVVAGCAEQRRSGNGNNIEWRFIGLRDDMTTEEAAAWFDELDRRSRVILGLRSIDADPMERWFIHQIVDADSDPDRIATSFAAGLGKFVKEPQQ